VENDAPSSVADPGSAFELGARVLRDRGCRCPLMWNGVVPVPATICEQQSPGPDHRVCKVLQTLPPVPERTSSDVRKPPEPTREAARPLDTQQPAAGD
jgi:hypothetical protein